VAEFFKKALGLPPESITYEWAGDKQPIASNDTEEGRALNRRVEVEVWYDEPREALVDKEVVVADDFKRIKVCRMETVCKLSYQEVMSVGRASRTLSRRCATRTTPPPSPGLRSAGPAGALQPSG